MFYVIIGLTVAAFLIHLAVSKKARAKDKILETLLLYILVFFVGVTGIMAFMGHVYSSNSIAHSIGWAIGSPFQLEVGMANLAFGVLGILCIWFRGKFWLATVIGWATFLLGDAWVHLRDISLHQNYASGNSGVQLYLGDLALPIIVLVLVIIYTKMSSKKPS